MACDNCSRMERLLYDAMRGLSLAGSERLGAPVSLSEPVADIIAVKAVKSTRKASKYGRAFGRNIKALRIKHPRTQPSTLLKRAHRMTKKEMTS